MKKKTLNSHSIYELFLFIGMTLGLWLKIIYAQLSIKINKVPIVSDVNKQMFYMALLTVLIIMVFLYLVSYKRPLLLPGIGAVVLGFIIFSDTLYGRYYYNPISFSIFHQVTMADNVMLSAYNLMKWKDLVFVLDFLVMGIFVLFNQRLKPKYLLKPRHYRHGLVLCILMVVSAGLFTNGYVKADKSNYTYERKYIARDMGLLYYHGFDLVKTIERSIGVKGLDESQKALIESANRFSENGTNVYTGRAEGYNLIVIQMEAFMNFLIDYEVEGVPVTPVLNGLKNESLYMANNYVQTANGNTVDAELMMNTSLLPAPAGSVYYEYPTNTYISLPKILEKKGYIANSFHSYEASFWNREIMHRTLGFQRFHSFDDFLLDEKTGWALSDKSFFRQSLAFTMEEAADQPFYSFMITLSSHHPYDGFITGKFSDVKASEGLLNHYYNAASYVDESIGTLIDDLKANGLYDHTVLVIYGDHSGLFSEDAVKQSTVDGNVYSEFSWTKYQQVPVIIHVPGVLDQGVRLDDVSGQLDILPTVANLMGLEGLYTLGTDVLSPEYEGLVVKRFGDVITRKFIYLSDQGEVFDYETGEVLSKEPFRTLIETAHEKLKVNDMIMSGDYFNNN